MDHENRGAPGHRAVRTRRRPGPGTLLWLSGALAAAVLALGASGTLSSWAQAVVGNTTNTTATAQAVVLSETSGANACASSDGAQTTVNVSSCTTINKYGGTTSPLNPGGSVTTDVTFKNVGAANASSFALTPGSCSQTPTAGSGTPPAANVCTNGDLTVAISCSPGATYAAGSAWTDLSYAAAAPPTAQKTHAGSDLNAGASWTCRFTVALLASAGVADQAVTLSQPLTWTLTQ